MPYRYTIETKNYVIKKTVYSSSHLTPSFDVTAGTVRLWGKDLGIVIKAYDQASSLMKEKDRKSTRLNSVTNAHLVCRLLLEQKKTNIPTRMKLHTQKTPK